MVDEKKLSFEELLKIESGNISLEEWLRHQGIYKQVITSAQAGVSPSLIFRTLRNNYGYGKDFMAIKVLCDEHGPKEAVVAEAVEV